MEKKKIIIILLIILAILLSYCSIMIWHNINQPTIYNNVIDGVGTFNTTNVTNFALSNLSDSVQTDYIANDSVSQVSITSSTYNVEISISEATKVKDSVGGHTIYKNTANTGEHKGEIRYFAILKDNDNERYIMISTPTHELTSMIVDSFKFLEPISKLNS